MIDGFRGCNTDIDKKDECYLCMDRSVPRLTGFESSGTARLPTMTRLSVEKLRLYNVWNALTPDRFDAVQQNKNLTCSQVWRTAVLCTANGNQQLINAVWFLLTYTMVSFLQDIQQIIDKPDDYQHDTQRLGRYVSSVIHDFHTIGRGYTRTI